jgi:hypothetical protein
MNELAVAIALLGAEPGPTDVQAVRHSLDPFAPCPLRGPPPARGQGAVT